jgi:ParB family transcriptional regulator, chromosome partitioning protein
MSASRKLDLTGLAELSSLSELAGLDGNVRGKPLELPLADVLEDPDQPRQFFCEEALDSLATQIRASGVRSPISVKPQDANGKYLINHGARRYRASLRAGKTTIPAFIDDTHDDYDRVAENIHREDLTPMEIALFIARRVALGDKKGAIAARLGQKAWFVSDHLALVEAPQCIQYLARGMTVGVRTLYDLIRVHAAFPTDVEAYVEQVQDVTRAGVAALLADLKMRDAAKGAHGGEPVLPGGADALTRDGEGHKHADARIENEDKLPEKVGRNERDLRAGSMDANAMGGCVTPGLDATRVSHVEEKRLAVVLAHRGRAAVLRCRGRVEIAYKDSGEVALVDLAAVDVLGVEVIGHEDPVLARS